MSCFDPATPTGGSRDTDASTGAATSESSGTSGVGDGTTTGETTSADSTAGDSASCVLDESRIDECTLE